MDHYFWGVGLLGAGQQEWRTVATLCHPSAAFAKSFADAVICSLALALL